MAIPKAIALPAAMESRLRQIRRRQWLFGWLQTAAFGASAFLFALTAALLIDWQWMLRDSRLRLALTGGTFVIAGLVVVATMWWRLRPLLKTSWAAVRADAVIPQLEERWTTVVTLASSPGSAATPAAQAMLQQVVHEAAAMGRLVQPHAVARSESSGRSLALLTVCMLLLLGVLSTDWPQTSVLWRRFWQPTADITATQLMSQTGDTVVPRGESVELASTLTGVPRSQALLLLEREAAPLETIAIASDSQHAGKFVHRVRVDKSFRYQMQAGDGNTAWHTVQAVDPPTLAEVQFVVESPSYVARPRLEKTHIPSRIKVLQGSRLFLRMRPATPLARCELAFTGESSDASSKVISLKPNTEGWYHFETLLEADLTFAPHLWNEHGLTNDEATTCRIQVIPDQAPVARILGSNSEAAVANDDVVKIEFEAHDDQGIASAQLIVYDESGVEKGEPPRILHIQDIPLGNQELQQHVLASLELDLKKLNLAAGSQISYAIRVMDNRMLNLDPQHPSPPLVADRDEETPTDSNDTAPSSDPRQPRNKSTPGGKRSQGDNMMRELTQKDDGSESDPIAMNEEQTAASKTKNASQTDDADATPSESTADTEKDGLPSPANNAATDERLQPDENGSTVVSALFPENVLVAGRENDGKSIATTGNPSPSQPARADQPKRSNGTTESPTTMLAVRPDQKNADRTATSEKDGADNSTPDKNLSTAGKTRPISEPDGSSPSEPPNATAKKKSGTKSSGNNNAENPVRIVVRNAVEPSNTDNKDDPTADPNVTPPDEHPSSNKERQTFLVDMVNGQQDAETRRRRLRITERQATVAAAKERQAQTLNVREQVVEIDRRLDAIETGLTRVVDRQIPDTDRPQHLQQLDQRLGEVEKQIANLRSETRESQFAFVGLQMVDIGRTHVTPARERVFVALREPDVGTDRNSTLALQSVLRARELLAALLARYDRVAQDQKLADALEESAKMYEIYIEKAQSLMREARQTRNPLERKMEILELDQDYLDRAAEVQRLRREMLAEFARVLGDDPRLLSRYLQLTKNRRDSLRDQLSHVAERQTDIAAEVRGWVQIQEDQRNDLFNVMVETRLQLATPLAKDAAELAEHVEKQLPLVLEPIQGTAEAVVKMARDLSATARDIALDVRRQLRNPEADIPWKPRSQQLGSLCAELEISLDRLNFEHEAQTEVQEYVTTRLLETRVVADHAAQWKWLVDALEQKQYAPMAELDQQQVALTTELLRVDILGIEAGLQAEFAQQEGATVPAEALELVRQLHEAMEAATFNQTSATFACLQNRMEEVRVQQQKACDQIARAEKLFDDIRRKVVEALDALPPRNPNIADLRDPSLDEFLAGLEREPNIEAQLGLPNRRRNLRIIADEIEWQENGAGLIGKASEEAGDRAAEIQEETERPPQQTAEREREMSDEERQARAQAEQMQQQMAKTLTEMQQRAADPTTSQEERERLERLVQSLQQFAEQSRRGRVPPHMWNQIAQSDQTKAALAAIAAGQRIPDQQWNKLMSSLDDGLLQVGGRTPPAEYRRAIEQYQNRLRRMLDGAATKND